MKYYIENRFSGKSDVQFDTPKKAYLEFLKAVLETDGAAEFGFMALESTIVIDEQGNEYQMEFKKVKK